MAKQTVINFKNCINMYIVLHGEVLKTKPYEAVTTWIVAWGLSIKITLQIHLHGYLQHRAVRAVHLGLSPLAWPGEVTETNTTDIWHMEVLT